MPDHKTTDCPECGANTETTGRDTRYCPDCDTCPTCGCPQVDGFSHYAGCAEAEAEEAKGQTTHEPTHPRPKAGELAAAIRSLAAAVAWEEWDAEPNRTIDDPDEYREGLIDLASDREMGLPEIAEAAMGLLGIKTEAK